MSFPILKLLLVQLSFVVILGQNNRNQNQDRGQKMLSIAYYNECEGSETANYTLLGQFTLAQDCRNFDPSNKHQLIQATPSKQLSVIGLEQLSSSLFPAGAFNQIETIWLATSGPLQGQYIYQKVITLSAAYLKKCSSVLGYSYVSSRSAVLLINQKLDLNIFLNPSGAFEVFKRGCTTTCTGKTYVF